MNKKVFISYAREDGETAARLFDDLKKGGYEPWLDKENLLGGQNWREEIPRVIEGTGHVLALISETSASKGGFLQMEWDLALDALDKLPGNEIFLIPVRLDDREIPTRMESLNWVDLFPDYEAGLSLIIKAMEKGNAPPPPPEKPLIYVSYALIDNENGWVATLKEHLASEIAQRIGSRDKFTLYMDGDADNEANPPPAPVLERVEKAAVFIPVVSPGYLASKRCARERHTFFRTFENREDAQILVVERLTIDEVSRPDEFSALRSKRFWILEAGAKAPRVLGSPTLNLDRDMVYFERVVDISDDVKDILLHAGVAPGRVEVAEPTLEKVQEAEPWPESIGEEAAAPEKSEKAEPVPEKDDAAVQTPDDRPAVYLAEVPGDLLDIRDDMERYLEQSGFRVAPGREVHGVDSDSFREAVKKELRDCRVFVQLLSGDPGKTRSIREGICRLQYECAQETGKIILQWCDRKLNVDDVTDSEQKTLLSGQTVIAGGMTEFKEQVVKRAGFKPPGPTPRDISPDVMVYLNADKKDETHAMVVAGVMDQHRVSCVLPIWEGNAAKILADMEDFILNSDGVIVIYGNVDALWVRKQLLYCRNLNYRREEPLKSIAVYQGPPSEKSAFNVMITGLEIIDCSDCPEEEKFKPGRKRGEKSKDCRDCPEEEKFKPFLNALRKGGRS